MTGCLEGEEGRRGELRRRRKQREVKEMREVLALALNGHGLGGLAGGDPAQ